METVVKYLAILALALASQQFAFSGEIGSTPRPGGKCAVWGRVIAPPYLLENGLDLKVDGIEAPVHEKISLSGSTFELKQVPPGPYYFRILNRSGQCLLKSTQQLKGVGDYFLLRFRMSSWQHLSENMVSARQLGHQVPGKATKLAHQAESAIEVGDRSKAIQLLEKAVALDPGFTDAQLELAVNYYHMDQKDTALSHAQAAYASDPDSVDAGQILGMILNHMKRYRDAEAVARCLLRTHGNIGEVQALLAVSMIGAGRNLDEALGHLKLAATDFPLARTLAAEVLMETGHPALAVAQIKTFMDSSASECERLELEDWIAQQTAETASGSQPGAFGSLSSSQK